MRRQRARALNKSQFEGRSGALLVMTLACVVLVVLAWTQHWSGLYEVLGALGALGGFVYPAWSAFFSDTPAPNATIADVADELAGMVGQQWRMESQHHHLNDPLPMPVSWSAELSLMDSWESLRQLATEGVGFRARSAPEHWAAGPHELSGTGSLVDAFRRVPTGRLVVLGAAGAGKSIALTRLVLDLLRPGSGDPVPVLLSLTSWLDLSDSLDEWIAKQLVIEAPELGTPFAGDPGRRTRIKVLLDAGLVLPVLDGLDEIDEHLRSVVIGKIRDSLDYDGRQAVIACRTETYRRLARPTRGGGVNLRAAAVLLHPLDAATISEYLRLSAGASSGRWDPVLAVLGTDHRVAQTLTSPLMLSLARTVYGVRPGEREEDLHAPAELLELADRDAVEGHLLDSFVPSVYQPPVYGPRPRGEWSAEQVTPWLRFLAGHLYRIPEDTRDFAWWQLSRSVGRRVLGFVVGAITFVVFGVAGFAAGGVSYGAGYGLAYGVTFGVATGVCASLGSKKALSGLEFRVRGNLLWSVCLLLAGSAVSMVFATAVASPSVVPAAAVVGIGLAVYGWQSTPSVTRVTPSPRATLARDRARTLLPSLALTLGFGTFGGLDVGAIVPTTPNSPLQIAIAIVTCGLLGAALGGIGYGRLGAVAFGACGVVVGLLASAWDPQVGGWRPGLAYGVAFGLGIGWCTALARPWAVYSVTRLILAAGGRLPLRLMAFLHDAHKPPHGVLRQNGVYYQFRHEQLQQRLAKQHSRESALAERAF